MIFFWLFFEIKTFPVIALTGNNLLFFVMFFNQTLYHFLRFAESADKATMLDPTQLPWAHGTFMRCVGVRKCSRKLKISQSST
jgi:hypothetical protein